MQEIDNEVSESLFARHSREVHMDNEKYTNESVEH